jgi:putative transposase
MYTTSIQVRLYPNKQQARSFARFQGSLRHLRNELLAASIAAKETDGRFLNRWQLHDVALEWKRDPEAPWRLELPAHAVLQAANNMFAAFRNYYEGRCNKPRFSKKSDRQIRIYCVNQNTRFDGNRIMLPKVGWMKWRGPDLPGGRMVCGQVWRDAGDRWMFHGVFEQEAKEEIREPEVDLIAVDLGLKRFATTTEDGETFGRIEPPRFFRKSLKRLRRAQRRLDRRASGSRRRERARRTVAQIWRKTRNQRSDFQHVVSRKLVNRASRIRLDVVNVKGLFNLRYIGLTAGDAALGLFLKKLRYKCLREGRSLEFVDRWYPSSQTCSRCGALNPQMKNLRRRTLRCSCGNSMDRDENAAANLYWYGEERRNLLEPEQTRAETGGQATEPKPVVEARMSDAISGAETATLFPDHRCRDTSMRPSFRKNGTHP